MPLFQGFFEVGRGTLSESDSIDRRRLRRDGLAKTPYFGNALSRRISLRHLPRISSSFGPSSSATAPSETWQRASIVAY